MPDFMRAGFLTDVTEQIGSNPHYAHPVSAYKDIAGYEDRINGVGITANVPVLAWTKMLFREAGLEPGQVSGFVGGDVPTLFAHWKKQPDAICCDNDQIAFGCIDALREFGIRVPDDVVEIGYDDWRVVTEACRPALSSVDMQLKTLGTGAVRRMLAMIDGKQDKGLERLPCRRVLREFTGDQATNERQPYNRLPARFPCEPIPPYPSAMSVSPVTSGTKDWTPCWRAPYPASIDNLSNTTFSVH